MCLGLLGLGRSQPARVTRPALHARPAPHIRPAQAPDRTREARAIRENRDAGARDAQPLGDVGGDHELGAGVDPHDGQVNSSELVRAEITVSLIGQRGRLALLDINDM